MTILSCQGISLAYEGRTVVSDLNFQVEAGSYLCLVGENGSGKTTLMRTLLGLKTPASGEIVYHGLQQNEIGYLPQQSAAQREFPASVMEIVLSGCLNRRRHPFYRRSDRQRAMQNLNRLGMGSQANTPYRLLSGGQQQRVLLARALCATSKLLLLDEPVTGLDPLATQELYELIQELNQTDGITVIMVSHDVHAAVREASHILHLAQTPLFFGTKDDYLQSEIGQTFVCGVEAHRKKQCSCPEHSAQLPKKGVLHHD